MSDLNSEETRIREALDRIEPGEGARERMLANIRRKAEREAAAPAETGKTKASPAVRFRRWALPIAACLVIAVAGAAALPKLLHSTDDPGVTTGGPDLTQITNPFVEVEDAGAIEQALNIRIDAPEGAQDVVYSIVDGEMADVRFTYGDHDYTLRASRQGGDFSGLYGEPAGEEQIDSASDAVYAVLREGEEVYSRITWTDGEVTYVLTNTDGADALAMRELYSLVH